MVAVMPAPDALGFLFDSDEISNAAPTRLRDPGRAARAEDVGAEPVTATTRVAAVLFPLPLPEPFDYVIPEDLAIAAGDHVSAPIGGRLARGVVWAVHEPDASLTSETSEGETPRRLKRIEARLPAPPVPENVRRLVDWTARYTCHPPGVVLRMALRGASAWAPARTETVYAPATDPPALRLTSARTRALEAATACVAAEGPATAAVLAKDAGVSAGVIKGLAEAGALIAEVRPILGRFDPPDPDGPRHDLTPTQQDAVEDLLALLDINAEGRAASAEPRLDAALIDGVTGSGKTEVYFEAIAETLRQDPDAQILVLLPEIALTQAVLSRFEQRFCARPAAWHSDIADGPRRLTWRAVAEGRARIVVGARSALFLPFTNLRLIIVDEEHDSSFKQEDGVPYQARDIAVVRARLEQAVILLASATPSLESLVNAQRGRYHHIVLPGRPGVAVLPEVACVDLRAHRPEKDRWLSAPLIDAAQETLDRDEQVLFFLNRRGYAPLVICRACGHRMKAPDTDSWLVEHRYANRLVCHATGYSIPKPKKCPECQAEDSLHAVGPGVERLEEEARAVFPNAAIEVFSSDTARDPAAVRDKVARMAEGAIDILIGTQIVAKGHNFPNLTLVGVVDADLGLRGGDLRAAERTYQTLVQVAGRAGRADKPGRALLQTCMPEHDAMAALEAGDRNAFLEAEMRGRDMLGLPPFGRLAALILSGPDEAKTERAARDIAMVAPRAHGVEVMGPAPAPIAVVRGKYRFRFLVRADLGVDLSAYMAAWRARLKAPASMRAVIDIDPYSFL